jgi:hypothetical protein
MERDWSQFTIMLSGTFLVFFGVGVIIYQMAGPDITGNLTQRAVVPQTMHASAEGFTATTNYVGVELVMVGAVLQIVGFLGRYSRKIRSPIAENKKAATASQD